MPLERLKNWARESYQDLHWEKALTIIRKLKLGEDLDPGESRLAEEWVVGILSFTTARRTTWGCGRRS